VSNRESHPQSTRTQNRTCNQPLKQQRLTQSHSWQWGHPYRHHTNPDQRYFTLCAVFWRMRLSVRQGIETVYTYHAISRAICWAIWCGQRQNGHGIAHQIASTIRCKKKIESDSCRTLNRRYTKLHLRFACKSHMKSHTKLLV
jgi:hypothetical protein